MKTCEEWIRWYLDEGDRSMAKTMRLCVAERDAALAEKESEIRQLQTSLAIANKAEAYMRSRLNHGYPPADPARERLEREVAEKCVEIMKKKHHNCIVHPATCDGYSHTNEEVLMIAALRALDAHDAAHAQAGEREALVQQLADIMTMKGVPVGLRAGLAETLLDEGWRPKGAT